MSQSKVAPAVAMGTKALCDLILRSAGTLSRRLTEEHRLCELRDGLRHACNSLRYCGVGVRLSSMFHLLFVGEVEQIPPLMLVLIRCKRV